MRQAALSRGLNLQLLVAFAFAIFLVFSSCDTYASEWKVGVSSVVITPQTPIPLVGYGGRSDPYQRVDIDIYAKALAFEDAEGYRGIIVTSDLVGVADVFFGPVCQRVMKATGLARSQIMLNASHNHTGPLLSLKPELQGNVAYAALDEANAKLVTDYTKSLQEKFYELMIAALDDLQPATLSWGSDQVEFVMNRRIMTPEGKIRMGPNPEGPADRVVPVLKVSGEDGKPRALLFGCACHNTGLTGDHNLISGDYAGYSQEALEKRYPGAVALFMIGCGADANPEPRTDVAGVRLLGLDLANAVTRVLEKQMQPIRGPLRTAIRKTKLPLKTYRPGEVEALAAANDVVGQMAKHLFKVEQSGVPLRTTYPGHIAAWAFGDDLTIVAFPSETVAEYALNLRAAHPKEPLWVAGYSNDLFGYVPTAQIVREGGHETIGVTTWLWGTDLQDQVGFFSEDVEPVMMRTATELIEEVSTKE